MWSSKMIHELLLKQYGALTSVVACKKKWKKQVNVQKRFLYGTSCLNCIKNCLHTLCLSVNKCFLTDLWIMETREWHCLQLDFPPLPIQFGGHHSQYHHRRIMLIHPDIIAFWCYKIVIHSTIPNIISNTRHVNLSLSSKMYKAFF